MSHLVTLSLPNSSSNIVINKLYVNERNLPFRLHRGELFNHVDILKYEKKPRILAELNETVQILLMKLKNPPRCFHLSASFNQTLGTTSPYTVIYMYRLSFSVLK